MTEDGYIHGFEQREQDRLYRQAAFLEPAIFQKMDLTGTTQLLEVGCGVGAMSEILLRRYPELRLTGIDVSPTQLERAQRHLGAIPSFAHRFCLRQMDAAAMDFAPDDCFDGAFLCWVLEHVQKPVRILGEIRRCLKSGGRIFITEVMNQSFFLHPQWPDVMQFWDQYNQLQTELGGDPHVGARVGDYLQRAGFRDIRTDVHLFHLDSRDPAARSAMFVYWRELLLSGAPSLIKAGRATPELVRAVESEMNRAQEAADSIFFYTFVQAWASA